MNKNLIGWTFKDMKIHNLTDGSEFTKGKLIIPNVKISHLTCEYCGCEIIGVWDEYREQNSWVPYLGNQVVKPGIYGNSKIIQAIKEYYHVGYRMLFTQEKGNNLLNSHARFHSNPNRWEYRCHKNSMRVLCNNCFQKTYNRIKIKMNDGTIAALSVLPDFDETVESVAEELGIKDFKILGKGAVKNY